MKKHVTLSSLLVCFKLLAACAAGLAGHSKNTGTIIIQDSTKKNLQAKSDTAKSTTPPLKQAPVDTDSAKQAMVVMGKDSTLAVVMINANDKTKPAATAGAKTWTYSMPSVNYVLTPIDPPKPEPEVIDNNPPVTSLIQVDSLRQTVIEDQIAKANLRKLILRNEQIKLAQVLKINNLDSLKAQLKIATADTIKALLYSRIAAKYMDYDTLANADKQLRYQNSAINFTLLAIHQYSLYNDSTGLRDSYTNLSKVYYSEKKYTEAKWFILQSNTMSRAKRDTVNIISSLVSLAAIKTDIKDYTLAMSDLNEALQLSVITHRPKTEADILKSYGLLYSNLQNYDKEAAVLKKRDLLLDSIHKAELAEAARVAALKKKKEQAAKKKQYLASLKKTSKNNSQAVVASAPSLPSAE